MCVAKASGTAYRFVEPSAEPPEIDEGALQRARSAIEKLKNAYLTEWAPSAIDELDRVIRFAGSSVELAPENLHAAYRLAHDMKGQGATFGFELLSEFGSALVTMTFEREEATPAEITAMLAYVAAARAVIDQRLDDPYCDDAVAVKAKLESALKASFH